MIRKDKDGRWFARKRVTLADGSKHRLYVVPSRYHLPNTRTGADEALRRALVELDPRFAPAIATSQTLAAFVDTFFEHSANRNKPSTLRAHRQIMRDHWLPRFGNVELHRITYATIEDAKHELLRTHKAKTVINILTVLRRALAVAQKRGLISKVPDIEWPQKSKELKIEFFTFEEAARLLAAAEPEWQPMILLAMRSGLRISELLGLTWGDVDLVAGNLRVATNRVRGIEGTPKSGRARTVPLASDALAALKAWRQEHPKWRYVFSSETGRPLTEGACKHPLYRACKAAGLRRAGWHMLRHTFCSHLVMRAVPLNTVRELAGHATIAMTLRYAHLAPSALRSAVDSLTTGQELGRNDENDA